jgi:COMPASS component SWD3
VNPNPNDGLDEAVFWDADAGKKLQARSIGNGHVEHVIGEQTALVIDYRKPPFRPYLESLSTGKISNLDTTIELNPASVWAVSGNGRFVAVGDRDQEPIELIDGTSSKRVRVLQTAGLTTHSLSFSRDEKLLFAFSPNQTTRIWDTSTGAKLAEYTPKKIPDNRPRPSVPSGVLVPPKRVNEEPPFEIALSPDGKKIGSTDIREYILLRDALDGQNQIRIETPNARPRIMMFSPNSKLLAWASWDDPTVHILDVSSQSEILTLPGHRSLILSIAFAKDGRKLVTSSSDGTALVWNMERGAAQASRD